jgi:hypothetical protein
MEAGFRRIVGISVAPALALVVLLSLLGGAIGVLFPQVVATAVLQVPRTYTVGQWRDGQDVSRVVDLEAYKRVVNEYASRSILRSYLEARKLDGSEAARRLLDLASRPDFWNQALEPMLPYNRKDQRQFGELKESAPLTLIGIELRATARTGEVAAEVVSLLSDYISDAWVRQEIEAWILSGKSYAVAGEPALQAEILRSEFDIRMDEQRAEDMKSIIARYPDAKRVDAQQVLSANPSEGVERFFSPIMQLVGAESTMSARRERIVRLKRQLRQMSLLAPFLVTAEEVVRNHRYGDALMAGLQETAKARLSDVAVSEDWASEVVLAVNAGLRAFGEARSQMGVRTSVELLPSPSRRPLRLALMGGMLGIGMLIVAAFVRSAR